MNRYFYVVIVSILIVIVSAGMYVLNSPAKDSIDETEKREEVIPPVKKVEKNMLVGRNFVWVKSELNLNKEVIIPLKKESYMVSFEDSGKVKISTDCNNGFGEYEVNGSKITFGNIVSTEKYCPDSQEGIFYNELISAESFLLDNSGNLNINIKIGTMFLKEVALTEKVNGVFTNLLIGKEYRWLRTELKNNKVILPISQGKFILIFSEDLKFTVNTDCNTNGGTYYLSENTLSFSETVATRMYCEKSQEEVFIRDLQKTSSFEILPDETLILNLSDNLGRMYFKK